ncbi:MAG: hypothetical protein IJY09_06310 [Lachnospiraceae bacterium]|nr:hypothetical protein [Lachnospiraceae bacterium]
MEIIELTNKELNEIESTFLEYVKMKSQELEHRCRGAARKGVQLEFVDTPSFQLHSRFLTDDDYRAVILFPRLQLMAMYQLFFQLKGRDALALGEDVRLVRWSMFYVAICCVLQHELAHIYRGHLYLRQFWKENWEQHILDWKTLEWDADRFVAEVLAEYWGVWKENKGKEETGLGIQMLCGTLHGMMFWQRRQENLCADVEREQQILVRECAILQRMPVLYERQQEVLEYIQAYEEEFRRVFKNNGALELPHNIFEVSSALQELQSHWEKIKKELQPYAMMLLEE